MRFSTQDFAARSSSTKKSLAPAKVDESGALKDQLSKAWKRIADLETRVHDLTLQSTIVMVRKIM